MNGAKLVMIIDGQGGGVGKRIAERLLLEKLDAEFIVVGTNAVATANMMKAGVLAGATGENACVYNAARADIIVGPIGIIFPNAMQGEISPAMARAIGESGAQRVLVPVANSHVHIAGLEMRPLGQVLDEAAAFVGGLCGVRV